METRHFRVVADHAPLVPGHTLVMPKAHYACYGTVPAELDAELAEVRAQVEAFLTTHYGVVTWFENGIFHQTVFHAHLHALPFGALAAPLTRDPQLAGVAVESRHDVRRWYAEQGAYTYIEEPGGMAAIFPADEAIYQATLRALRSRLVGHAPWQGPRERYLNGTAKVQALLAQWRVHENK